MSRAEKKLKQIAYNGLQLCAGLGTNLAYRWCYKLVLNLFFLGWRAEGLTIKINKYEASKFIR